ncbi:MAG: YihY family inner membrane protein [Gammaproteobacteria bacterium]|nr:YihY family inner membrane protein [Gammaproteobacteria bacterium]
MFGKVKRIVGQSWNLFRFILRHYVEDSCQTTASALTYQTLFAVVPALTVMYTVLSTFESFGGMGRILEDFIFTNVVPENVAVVQDYLRGFSEDAQNLSIPSAIFLAVTAFLMLFTIERTFSEIWRIKEPRHGLQRLMMYWAVLSFGPLLVGAGIGVTTYILSLPLISDVADSPAFLLFLPVLLSASTFTLVFAVVPNTLVPLRHAVIGGVLVAAGFESAKFMFVFVMSRSDFELIYGAFAVVPLFLLWIYVSWTIVLMGAELVKSLGVYRFKGSDKLEDPLFQVLIILDVFHQAHQKGQVVTENRIRDLGSRIDLEMWSEYRQQLVALNLIRPVEKGGLVLLKDLSEITIWELYEKLPWPLPAQSIDGKSGWEATLSETFKSISGRNQGVLGTDLESLFRSQHQTTPE